MSELTLVEYAKLLEITRQSLYGAIKRGKVELNENNLIDTESTVNSAYTENIKIKKKIDEGGLSVNQNVTKKSATQYQADLGRDQRQNTNVDSNNIYELSQVDLNRLDVIEKIRKNQVATAEKRKELIDRKLFITFIHRLYAIDTNELAVMCSRIAPSIAAIFESEDGEKILRVEQMLQDDTYKTLQHIKEEMNKFLNRIKNDGLDS